MQLCAPLFCLLSLLLPHTYTRTFFVSSPFPFIFALFPDCFGNPSGSSSVRSPSNQGNLVAVSPFPTPVRSDPFTGWVPPNLLGAPSPFSVSCWVDRYVHLFPFWVFPFAAPRYRFTPILVFWELVFSSFPTPLGSSFRSALLAVPRFPFPFLGVSLPTLGVYFLAPALRLSTRFG